jgi:diketogulonate reductase-like aldo/keto reductase
MGTGYSARSRALSRSISRTLPGVHDVWRNSDLRITRPGIGAWAIGWSGWNGSMGPQNESDSIPAIHAALDLGLNWIDTAALYGLGHTEEVVSQALRGRGPHPYVFTKCERVWDASGTIGAGLKAALIRKECEDSLRRLQADGIAPITSLQPPIRLSLARSRKKFFPSPLRENIGVIVYIPRCRPDCSRER